MDASEEILFKDLWNNDLSDEELSEMLKSDFFFNLTNKKKKELIGKLNFADRAHITLGLCREEKAMQSGVDMMNLKLRLKLYEMLGKSDVKCETEAFEFYYLDNCYCFAKLREPIVVSGIFSFEL